jgi:hypothetical protein
MPPGRFAVIPDNINRLLGAWRVIIGTKFAYNFNFCLKSIKLIKLTSS